MRIQTEEKKIGYQNVSSYSTLNDFTVKTKHIWFVCHGMGYLSRYFIKYFEGLNPEENYIIAPQAPSKYYQKNDFKHVGASWLTKENTFDEMENIQAYFNAIYENEIKGRNVSLIALGFSQGVSVLTRWISKNKVSCDKLILYAGSIPNELTPDDFSFFRSKAVPVQYIYGTSDEYINDDRIRIESAKANALFGDSVEILPFDGTHEMKKEIINHII